jgi:hypothetical protein
VRDKNEQITIQGREFTIVFDKADGQISSWTYRGREIIERGGKINLFRAPTDNDLGGSKWSFAYEWKTKGLDKLKIAEISVTADQFNNKSVLISVDGMLKSDSTAVDFGIDYTIYGTGDIAVNYKINTLDTFKSLPKVGMQFFVPQEFNEFHWYGRGPNESYSDRKMSEFVGEYDNKVADNYVAYPRPQENGNKTDVRWVSLTDAQGFGLIVIADSLINTSAHTYSLENLYAAKHTPDIKEAGFITLNIDYAQMGLGGDDSWSARVHSEYRLTAKEYEYSFRIRPIDWVKDDVENIIIKKLPKK